MGNLKFVMGMMAAGGMAGVAGQAMAAETVMFNFDAPTDGTPFYYEITLEGGQQGGQAQFKYEGGAGPIFVPPFGIFDGVKHTFSTLGTARLNPAPLSTFSLPTSDAGMTANEVITYAVKDDVQTSFEAGTDTYFHLTFENNDGADFLGTVKFDGTILESITYTAAVPEPDAWALMILGVGATGAVLRRRRQAQLAA